jgi:trimethylamine corrinoid protein
VKEQEHFDALRQVVIEGHLDRAVELAKEAVAAGIDPVEAIEKGLRPGITHVGDLYGKEELFLPDLVMAADAMKAATDVLEAEIAKRGGKTAAIGTLVIGTVAGDVHSIGKGIVATMFRARGFQVIDLGIDVPTAEYVKVVEEQKPDLLGLSALMTVTAEVQGEVIEALKEKGIRDRVKVIVGGGAVTAEFAEQIGADGYGNDADAAVRLGLRLVGRG